MRTLYLVTILPLLQKGAGIVEKMSNNDTTNRMRTLISTLLKSLKPLLQKRMSKII